ncbi:rhomboid family intramembrane serine protease [Streptomyces sp. SL13]|jgi:membrane associated rhomboid family serine protease|uniref:Rhomboid family intramembrane serine protease n=1 Tax=Streptantibioticus silvisoli TaxID=2705255 RepID=A0AA90H574_9ACTN|nr:rhomboid family intramembrane serine protease [Streptantibioticus silvisoli]MDI5964321.1 rhomboid family intramembrane serine protease [Streptantibioticus silvisoli]MDI5970577.1 rhomboid family intramembrane serine protease [Streptantibioticus silvisoli]
MEQVVSCYRHPDRETGVSCARCGRPICPDCMVSASVGFQCPSCLNEGRQTAPPPPRTVAGAVLAKRPPLVTIALILANVALFAAVHSNAALVQQLALNPAEIAQGQYYRLITAVFLHQALAHIGMNMLSLWWIGPAVENALGRARYLALYLVAGLGGSALSFLLLPANEYGLGASGAIFGLLGALFVLVRRVGGDLRQVVIVIVLNLVLTFSISGIDWRAHVGGLITGAAIAYGMVHAPRARRALVQWGTCAGMLVVVLVVITVGVVVR